MRVDTWLVPMVHGDRFILCSDGLVDEVHDDDIATIALAAADPQSAADQLVAKANANGGRDNVTVVVVDVLQGVEPTEADSELESEPGWPGSDSTSTMIDADANSVLSTVGSSPTRARRGALSCTSPGPTSRRHRAAGERVGSSCCWGPRRSSRWSSR